MASTDTTLSGARRERRVAPRVAFDAPALIDSQRFYAQAVCRDVSASGLKVRAERELPIGSIVDVYFELPNGMTVDTRARVVRCERGDVCVCFLDPAERSVAALGYYVRSALLGRQGVLRAG